ncbi:MAG: DUF6036 family nucleotidyltransferase [Deinococcota bacterium]
MLTSPDFKELLSLFKKHSVRYLIVGGYAVMRYTEPRFTKDLDLLIAVDENNARAVYTALKEFGAPLKHLSAQDFAAEGYFYQMGNPPLRVDVLMSIPGVSFEDVWKRRETITIAEVEMHFIAKTDLIKAKRAAGRAQDLLDLENLQRDVTSE